MERIKYSLTNCYGIQKLKGEFVFSCKKVPTSVIAVYAKNGLMKTSFAKTFKKIQDKKQKSDFFFYLYTLSY